MLTAARELQQITNQITSLQNQAQMLINQARNLASLPYSSLQQLQSSIQRTQQLLAQAQNIAYNVQQIDRAFQTTYGSANASQSNQALITNAQARWQNSVARSAGRIAGAGRRRRQSRHQPHADVGAGARRASRRPARFRRRRPAIRSSLSRPSNSRTSRPLSPRKGRAQSLQAAQQAAAQDQGKEQLRRFLTPGAGYQSTTITMFHQ